MCIRDRPRVGPGAQPPALHTQGAKLSSRELGIMVTIAHSAPASLARGLTRGVAVRAGGSAKSTVAPRAVRRDAIRIGGSASRRGVAARAVDGEEKTEDSKDVLDSLSSILGIDPEEKTFLMLKSRIHYRAGFGRLAKQVIECAGSGVCGSDYSKLNFKNVRRPIYPLDNLNDPTP